MDADGRRWTRMVGVWTVIVSPIQTVRTAEPRPDLPSLGICVGRISVSYGPSPRPSPLAPSDSARGEGVLGLTRLMISPRGAPPGRCYRAQALRLLPCPSSDEGTGVRLLP